MNILVFVVIFYFGDYHYIWGNGLLLESIYLYFPPSSQLLYLCFCPVFLSCLLFCNYFNYLRGKESTEVRISQNKGKESENSYQKLKRSLKDRHTETVRVFAFLSLILRYFNYLTFLQWNILLSYYFYIMYK